MVMGWVGVEERGWVVVLGGVDVGWGGYVCVCVGGVCCLLTGSVWTGVGCDAEMCAGCFTDIGSRPHPVQLMLVRDHSLISCEGCTMWLPLRWFLAGCPSFFARLPVLGGLLRQVSWGTPDC